MTNPKFQANVTFEIVDQTRKWTTYKVTDGSRGHLGFFRIDKDAGFCDERDGEGILQLGPFFSGDLTTEAFVDRFELLNWVFEVFDEFLSRDELPKYEFIST